MRIKTCHSGATTPPDPLRSAIVARLRLWLAWVRCLVERYRPAARYRAGLQMLLRRPIRSNEWKERVVERIHRPCLSVSLQVAARPQPYSGVLVYRPHPVAHSVNFIHEYRAVALRPIDSVAARYNLFRTTHLRTMSLKASRFKRSTTAAQNPLEANVAAFGPAGGPFEGQHGTVRRAEHPRNIDRDRPVPHPRRYLHVRAGEFPTSHFVYEPLESHLLPMMETVTRVLRKVRRVEEGGPGPIVPRWRKTPAKPVREPAQFVERRRNPVPGETALRETTPARRSPEAPNVNVAALTDAVMRQLDRRMSAWRERTGRA